MKTAEESLLQWASGEITFDFGRGRRVFTREQFSFICTLLTSQTSIQHYIRVTDEREQEWDVPVETFMDSKLALDATHAITANNKQKNFLPQVVIQFENLDEVARWARGQLDGKNGVLVQNIPPVDSWMRPL